MTSEERNERIKKMFEDDLALLLRKGHDYSGERDCMANLRDFGFLGSVVRIGDKYHRLKNFCDSGVLRVSDESVLDTLRDLRNYGFLAQILYEDEKGSHRPGKCAVCGGKFTAKEVIIWHGSDPYCERCHCFPSKLIEGSTT